jgi:hypothetical protein
MGSLYDFSSKPSHGLNVLFVRSEFMKIYLRFQIQLGPLSFVEVLVGDVSTYSNRGFLKGRWCALWLILSVARRCRKRSNISCCRLN